MRLLLSESSSNSSPAAKHSAMEPLQEEAAKEDVGIHPKSWTTWAPLAPAAMDDDKLTTNTTAQITRKAADGFTLAIVFLKNSQQKLSLFCWLIFFSLVSWLLLLQAFSLYIVLISFCCKNTDCYEFFYPHQLAKETRQLDR